MQHLAPVESAKHYWKIFKKHINLILAKIEEWRTLPTAKTIRQKLPREVPENKATILGHFPSAATFFGPLMDLLWSLRKVQCQPLNHQMVSQPIKNLCVFLSTKFQEVLVLWKPNPITKRLVNAWSVYPPTKTPSWELTANAASNRSGSKRKWSSSKHYRCELAVSFREGIS